MAFITADRVLDSSTSTGTGAFVVSGTPAAGYQTFSSVMSVGDTCYYSIQGQTTSEWEVGLGTYSSANTLTRTTVYSSSNAGSAVTFSAGTKNVFITMVASRSPQLNASGNVTDLGTPTSVNLTNATNLPLASGVSGTLPTANGGLGASVSPTTAGNVLFTADGSVWSSTQKIARGTSVSASGTSVSFTGLPAWVKRITVMLNGISLSGTSYVQIQLGTSGGFVTSGYSSGVAALTSAGAGLGAVAVTTGFYTTGSTTQTDTASGVYFISNLSGNIWSYAGTGVRTGNVATYFNSAAPLSLGGALTQVRISSGNGTDTFDAGSVNILYE